MQLLDASQLGHIIHKLQTLESWNNGVRYMSYYVLIHTDHINKWNHHADIVCCVYSRSLLFTGRVLEFNKGNVHNAWVTDLQRQNRAAEYDYKTFSTLKLITHG